MARLRLPLSVITTIAMVSGALLLGSSVLASPCPLSASNPSGGIGNPRNPNGSDEPPGFDRMNGSGDAFRRSDGFNRGRDAGLTSDVQRLDVTNAEIAGFAAIAGLFAIAIFSKVRHVRKLAPGEVDRWHQDPFLEHPEMVLALVPQEALSSAFETEAVTPRR